MLELDRELQDDLLDDLEDDLPRLVLDFERESLSFGELRVKSSM